MSRLSDKADELMKNLKSVFGKHTRNDSKGIQWKPVSTSKGYIPLKPKDPPKPWFPSDKPPPSDKAPIPSKYDKPSATPTASLYTPSKKEIYGPKEKWISAGGVVVADDDWSSIYVCKPSNNFGPWAFPKGRVEPDETLAQAAVREVEEETGLKCKIAPGGYLGPGTGGYSITHFYVMTVAGGTTNSHDPEMEEIRKVTWAEALKLFAEAHNSRDIRICMKAWDYARRLQKRKHLKQKGVEGGGP